MLGSRSPLPETYGSDFLMYVRDKVVGCQRKECRDLIASIRSDDRFSRELHQLKEADRAVLIVEGAWQWRRDGVSGRRGCEGFTRQQYDGLVLSVQSQGILVLTTDNIPGTIDLLGRVERFFETEHHDSLFRRPKSRGLWGTHRDKDWACHLYQSWDGLATVRGGAFYDKWGVPLRWTITRDQMMEVPGIGPGTADKLWNSLDTPPTTV